MQAELETIMKSDFIVQLVRQIRAQDTYDVYAKKSDEALIEPYIVDKAKRKEIPITGEPDAKVLARLEMFYSAIGILIEKRTGIMASPVKELHHEGFGRLVLTAGRLIVVNRYLRDLHRFGFNDPAKLLAEAEKMVEDAVSLIEKYREVAEMS